MRTKEEIQKAIKKLTDLENSLTNNLVKTFVTDNNDLTLTITTVARIAKLTLVIEWLEWTLGTSDLTTSEKLV